MCVRCTYSVLFFIFHFLLLHICEGRYLKLSECTRISRKSFCQFLYNQSLNLWFTFCVCVCVLFPSLKLSLNHLNLFIHKCAIDAKYSQFCSFFSPCPKFICYLLSRICRLPFHSFCLHLYLFTENRK